MEFCIEQKLEAYNWESDAGSFGIYETYKSRPALLAIVLLMTTTPFQYEYRSIVPPPKRFGNIEASVEGLLTDTLYSTIGGKMVMTLIQTLTPLEFLQYLDGFTLHHLPIRKFYNTDAGLLVVIQARVSAWFHAQKVLPVVTPLNLIADMRAAELRVVEAVNATYHQQVSQ